jgi:DNA-binding GntR family transcriptional regulator
MTMIQTVTRESSRPLAQQVYEQLRQRIITGEYQSGAQLREGVLAAEFGISKTPVREALGRLVQEELVDVIARSGYVVRGTTVEEVEALFELRLIVECAAARLAAERMTEPEIERLELLMDVTFGPRDHSYEDFFAANREFHLAIARGTHNPHISRTLASIFDKVDRALRYRLDRESTADLMKAEHSALVAAIKARDPERARREAEAQIRTSRTEAIRGLLYEQNTTEPRSNRSDPALRSPS